MTATLSGQFPKRKAPAGDMVVIFIKTKIQSKVMKTTLMILGRRILKRDLTS